MLSVSDIIERAGGPSRVSERLAGSDLARTYAAVRKWTFKGIPRTHYDVVSDLAGVSIADIHAANRQLSEASRQRPKPAALSSAA